MTADRPLSAFVFCPRCGSQDGGSPSVKQFVCNTCGFQYFQNAAAAVIALIQDSEGRLLFVRRDRDPAKGKLGLPGGFVDPHESAETALTREVKEETGLDLETMLYRASFPNRYDYGGVTYYTMDLIFLCTVSDARTLQALDEAAEVLWLKPESVSTDEIAFASARAAVGLLTR